jgi:phosphatidylserine/phosphatidylglycerophosphate/cardiolipin synthase-like enzyme
VSVTIALSTVTAFSAALRAARRVDFVSYTLHGGQVRDALLAAALAGADVRVRLEREPLDDAAGPLRAANVQSVALLAAAGADAALTPAGTPVLHAKAALVDGSAWLDDRNWTGDVIETVVRDSDPADVAALGRALAGDPAAGVPAEGSGSLETTKRAAAAAEAALIRAAGDGPIAVETESFGVGAVYDALLDRGRAGLPARLLVAGREARAPGKAGEVERRLLARLESLGIDARSGYAPAADSNEKLAVAGQAAWIGSANATYAGGAAGKQAEWGIVTRSPQLIERLRAIFETNWSRASRGKV